MQPALFWQNHHLMKKNEVKQVIGTGAYQATKIEPPQKIEQKAFADYWGEKAKIQNVTYLANSRSETRALLAQSKPNYLVFTLDSASLERLQQDTNIQVQSKSLARTIQYKVVVMVTTKLTVHLLNWYVQNWG